MKSNALKMAPNSHFCLICGKIRGDVGIDGISYHRIQKGREKEWLGLFGLTPETLNRKIENVVLCNRHFTLCDFYVGKNKRTIKKGSIPSVRFIDDATLEARKILLTKLDKNNSVSLVPIVTNKPQPQNRGRVCFFCKEKTVPGSSLFKFPNDERRKLWAICCKFEASIPKNALLCNRHFETKYFSKAPGTYGRAFLEKDAVPTIFDMNNETESASTSDTEFKVDVTMESNGIVNQAQSTLRASIPSSGCNAVPLKFRSCFQKNEYVTPSIKAKKPRYAGDVKLPQMKNKHTAKISLGLLKSKISQQKREIIILKKQLARRNKRISNLLQAMKEIRKQK